MAEVLLTFDTPTADESGIYRARVVGRQAEDHMWEGWLEFERIDGQSETLIGPVESRQPEREHLEYWAGGLTPVYLEGALHRARRPLIVRTRVHEEPASEKPAPRMVIAPARDLRRDAVLDPFEIGGRNLDILGQELRALNRPRLLNIIDAYHLNPRHEDISWMTDLQLGRFIVVSVEARLLHRAP